MRLKYHLKSHKKWLQDDIQYGKCIIFSEGADVT